MSRLRKANMLQKNNTVLVLVDVQEKLVTTMFDQEMLIANLQILIQGMQVFGIPIIVTEQYPEKLGPTIPELKKLLADTTPISKLCFSSAGSDEFRQALRKTNRGQVLVAGIETHVCVYQTAVDLNKYGYEVEVVADAVSSRVESNKNYGLEKMKICCAGITTTEMALFELLGVAGTDEFKKILKIVK